MARKVFYAEPPTLRLTAPEFEALPKAPPGLLCELPIGFRWREDRWGGTRICEVRGFSQDAVILDTFKPIIRVPAVSRLVPRPEASA